jgi:hypothetical protein
VIPVLPLILLVTAAGLVFLVRRFVGRGTLAVTALLCVPLIAGAARRTLPMIGEAVRCTSADPLGPTTCSSPDQRSFFAAAAYARENTPPDAAFVTLKEATFALLSERRVQHPERLILQDSLRLPEIMRASGLDYVLLTPLHDSGLTRHLLRRCDELEVVQTFPAQTYILKLSSPADSTGGIACSVLNYFLTQLPPRRIQKSW